MSHITPDSLLNFVSDFKDMPGVCYYMLDTAEQYVKDWPGYSGNLAYPVPHPTLGPEEAYHQCARWADDDYGKARRDLVRYLLQNKDIEWNLFALSKLYHIPVK